MAPNESKFCEEAGWPDGRTRRGCFLRFLLLIVILLVASALAAAFLPLTPLKPGVESRLCWTVLGRKVT
jgi:hypothetical protein